MQWRSVSDSLPESPDRVIICCKTNTTLKYRVTVAVYSGGAWRFFMPGEQEMKSERVTHWMPLPEAPE